jgi:hypothetical protein
VILGSQVRFGVWQISSNNSSSSSSCTQAAEQGLLSFSGNVQEVKPDGKQHQSDMIAVPCAPSHNLDHATQRTAWSLVVLVGVLALSCCLFDLHWEVSIAGISNIFNDFLSDYMSKITMGPIPG